MRAYANQNQGTDTRKAAVWGLLGLLILGYTAVCVVNPDALVAAWTLGIPLLCIALVQRFTGRGAFISGPAMFLSIYFVMTFAGVVLAPKATEGLSPSDVQAGTLTYLGGIVSFALSSILVARMLRFDPVREIGYLIRRVREDYLPDRRILQILMVSTIACLLISYFVYFRGRLPILVAFGALLTDPGADTRDELLSARFDLVYQSGTAVLEQFRYVLGPFTNVCLIVLGRRWNSPLHTRVGFAVLPLTILMLLGTGQRHPFVSMMVLTAVILCYTSPDLVVRVGVPFGVGAFTVMWFQTYLLGRFIKTGDLPTDLANALMQVFDRFVRPSAEVAFGTYALMRHDAPRMGATWLNDITGLVPFVPPMDEIFSRELFRLLYGKEGTASPSGFTEAFANLGSFGPTLIGLFFGAFLTVLFVRLLRLSAQRDQPLVDTLFLAYYTYLFARVGHSGFAQTLIMGVITIPAYWLLIRVVVRLRPTTSRAVPMPGYEPRRESLPAG